MALDVTINLNDTLEAELVKLTNEANALILPPQTPLSPAQFLRRDVRDRLQLSIQQREDSERLRIRAAFNSATPEVQAQVKTLLGL